MKIWRVITKTSDRNYLENSLRLGYQFIIALGLCSCLSSAYGKSQNEQDEFEIGDLKISLLRSADMHYPGFTVLEKNGKKDTLFVPHITKAMVAHYSSDQNLDEIDEFESGIESAVVAEKRLWFGLSFYAGEGTDGMGGIGFFDPKLKKIGILRHPALVNCSVKAIQVTPLEILALTYSQGELSEGICNGLVAINRKTLASTLQKPKGNLQILWDKDGELSAEEKLVGKQYENASGELAAYFRNWPKKVGPTFTASELEKIDSIGLENYMLHQAEDEYNWFDQSVAHGKIIFEQSCKLAVNEQPQCTLPLREIKDCDGERVCMGFTGLIRVHFSMVEKHNYGCSPRAWGAIPLLSDKSNYGLGGWQVDYFYAPGRMYSPVDLYLKNINKKPVSIVNVGYESLFFSRGKKNRFSVEAIDFINVTCQSPFEEWSGPAIKSASIRLTTTEINQTYVPSETEAKLKGLGSN